MISFQPWNSIIKLMTSVTCYYWAGSAQTERCSVSTVLSMTPLLTVLYCTYYSRLLGLNFKSPILIYILNDAHWHCCKLPLFTTHLTMLDDKYYPAQWLTGCVCVYLCVRKYESTNLSQFSECRKFHQGFLVDVSQVKQRSNTELL